MTEDRDPEEPEDFDRDDSDSFDRDDTSPCPHCGHQILDTTDICPHCGNFIDRSKSEKTPWITLTIAALIVIFLIILLITGRMM